MEIISVIIPVYNVEKYLSECLDSVLNQSYKDFELILVDDGSTDNSGIICDEYEKKDSRVKVIHQENQGQGGARNTGVNSAKNEWIVFLDSDDVFHPQLIEYLFRAIRENDVKISACPRVQGAQIPKDFFENRDYSCDLIEINEDKLCYLMENTNYYWALFPSVIDKSILKKYPFAPGRIYEDNAVTPKWLCECESIAIVDTPMYFYRDNHSGTMLSEFSLKKLDYLWALSEQIALFISMQYNKLSNVLIEKYVFESFYLGKRLREELSDLESEKKVLRDVKRLCAKYSYELSEKDKRFIFQHMHPILYKTKKRFKL